MKGRLKRTWNRLDEEENMKVNLCTEDDLCQSKRFIGVNHIATRLR